MNVQRETVLVLPAHPDDDVLGMGATMAMLGDLGVEVHVRVATGGERGGKPGQSPADTRKMRLAELAAACDVLGVKTCGALQYVDEDGPFEFVDGRLANRHKLRTAVVSAVQEVSADVVFTTAPKCYHPDHRALGKAVRDCQQSYGKRRAPMILFMDQFVRGQGIGTRRPDITVDATPGWARKKSAWACHASQQDPVLDRSMDALGCLRALQRDEPGVEVAEGFRDPRTVGHDAGLRWLIRTLEG